MNLHTLSCYFLQQKLTLKQQKDNFHVSLICYFCQIFKICSQLLYAANSFMQLLCLFTVIISRVMVLEQTKIETVNSTMSWESHLQFCILLFLDLRLSTFFFQSCRGGATASCLAQGHNAAPVGIKPIGRFSQFGVQYSTIRPLHFHVCIWPILISLH